MARNHGQSAYPIAGAEIISTHARGRTRDLYFICKFSFSSTMSFYKELNNLSTADFYEYSTAISSERKASSATRE